MTTTTLPKLVCNRSWLLALLVCIAAPFSAACGHAASAEVSAPSHAAGRARVERTCTGRLVDTDAGLEALRGCRVIAGDLRILRTNVSSFEALSGLLRVDGQLDVSGNRHLSSLKGLDRLARVGRLSLRNNPHLASLSALARLRSVRAVVIEGAPSLADSSGLQGIAKLDALTIAGTALATLDGLTNVRAVGELTLIDNPYLISVRALRRVEEARSVEVRDNPLLYGGAEEFFPRLIRAERVSVGGNFSMSRTDVASFLRRVAVGPGVSQAASNAANNSAGEVHASR